MFWILAFCLLLGAKVEAQNRYGMNPELISKFQNFATAFQMKCLKHVEPSEFANIMKSLENIPKCFTQEFSTPDAICKNYEKVYEPCLKQSIYEIKKCLDSDEQYLPDFVLNGQKNSMNRLCDEGNIMERIESLTTIKCTEDFHTVLQQDVSSKCIPQLKILKNLDKMMISLNKQDVCSDIEMYRICLLKAVEKKCTLSTDNRKLISTMFEDQLKECKAANGSTNIALSTINNFVYIILGITIWQLNK